MGIAPYLRLKQRNRQSLSGKRVGEGGGVGREPSWGKHTLHTPASIHAILTFCYVGPSVHGFICIEASI